MRRVRERRKAAGLHAVTHWEPARTAIVPYFSPRLIEARSLAKQAVTQSETLMTRLNETDIAAHQL